MPSLGGITVQALLCIGLVISIDASYAEYMPQYEEAFDNESKDRDYGDPVPVLDNKFEHGVSEKKYFETENTEENPLYEHTTRLSTKLLDTTENIDFDIFSTRQKFTTEKKYYINRETHYYKNRDDYNDEYDRQFDRRDKFKKRKKPSHGSHEVNNENADYDNADIPYEHNTKFYRRKPRDRQMTVTNDNGDSEYVSTRRTPKNQDEINKPRRRKEKSSKKTSKGIYQSSVRKKYPKEYENYADYEDMRRLINIKDKLPALLKKNKVRDSRSTYFTTSDTDLQNKATDITYEKSLTEATPNSTIGTTEIDEYVDLTTLTPNIQLVTNEMSLAEKSRLSILRKTQKKDRVKGSSKKKPPVLLQLQTSLHTSKLNTIVMLESSESTSVDPESALRAREVSNDSDETLKKVKKLMREKLVNNAKSMNDLIDNWDEMICDYVDISLLKNNVCISQANFILISILLTKLFLLNNNIHQSVI